MNEKSSKCFCWISLIPGNTTVRIKILRQWLAASSLVIDWVVNCDATKPRNKNPTSRFPIPSCALLNSPIQWNNKYTCNIKRLLFRTQGKSQLSGNFTFLSYMNIGTGFIAKY